MPLIEPLSKPMEQALAASGVDRLSLLAAVATDLTPQGFFGEEWLILTPERVRVFTTNGAAPDLRCDLELKGLRSASSETLVGGGALLATVDGQTHELLRFSSAHHKKFGRIAKYLNDVAKHRRPAKQEGEGQVPPRLEPDAEERKRCPQCQLLLHEGTRVCPACMSKGKVIRRMLRYMRPHWKKVALVWGLMLVGLGLSLIPPYLTRPLTDVVLNPIRDPLPKAERLALLGRLVLVWMTVQALGQALGVWRGRISVALGTRLSHELRAQLFQHLQMLSLKFFDKRQTGALMSRVTRDTQAMEAVLVDGVQNFFSNLLLFLGIGVVLLAMNWRLTLLVFIPAPFVLVLSKLFWIRIMSLMRRSWHLHSRLSAVVNDSLTGVRVVRAFAKEDREVERFLTRSQDLCQAETAAEQMWTTLFPLLFFIMSIGQLVVWYVGGREVIGEEFTLGTLLTFIAYLSMFYGPLQYMSRLADYLARSLASAERVFEILDSDPELKDAKDAVPMPCLAGAVEFKDVVFGYDKHKPVLKNVSFNVPAGEMIGLVGKSGAGKSTTINLLCRFYEVDEGQILIDGVDIRKIPQHDLRSQIGVVLQDTFLFSGTIAENIAYAKPEASREEVMAAAKAANAHDFIVQKPDGYDTQVGERGQALSTGERQRVSIARAILHNPRILIFDEATSSVDSDTEKQIQEAVGRLVKGRTTFAIAHRLSTLRHAHRLVVLKDGKLEEMGTHEELMAKKGEFHRLVQMHQEMSRVMGVGG